MPPELRTIAYETTESSLSNISRRGNERLHQMFCTWRTDNKVSKVFCSENVTLSSSNKHPNIRHQFCGQCILCFKVSSHDWLEKLGWDESRCRPSKVDRLKAFQEEVTNPFTHADIETFIRTVPNEWSIAVKLVAHFALFDVLRKSEVATICTKDVSRFED